MNHWQAKVREFHLLSGQAAPERVDFARLPFRMRIKLIREEAEEVENAMLVNEVFGDIQCEVDLTSELVDLLYVVLGTAVSAGVDLEPFFDAIHDANMAKVDGSLGPTQIRADGKIIKPPNWKPANLLPLLLKQKESKP